MSPADFDRWLTAAPRRALVMGILNVTPDSFSDGGRFDQADAALAHGREMVEAGADLIDVGGESTRPGSLPVPADVQIRRVVPVIRALAASKLAVTISVDTTRGVVAEAALDAGASIVNDVSGGRDDPALLPLVARRGAAVVLMHMRGTPATMQVEPTYDDVTREVATFLIERAAAAEAAGIAPWRILLDPGIGFGKTTAHNLQLLRGVAELAAIGRPLLVGTSRKGFIGKIVGEPPGADPAGRVFGTAATVAWAVANGAGIMRVHDVGPMAQIVRAIEAIRAG